MNGAVTWDGIPGGMDRMESHPWNSILGMIPSFGVWIRWFLPRDGILWIRDKMRSHPWMANPGMGLLEVWIGWDLQAVGPAGLGSSAMGLGVLWARGPFGQDPPDGWSRNTARLLWKEMRWSRTPLVVVLDPHKSWDPTDQDKALCPP